MRVVGFAGMPGAGKSVAAEAARGLGIPVLRMGDAVWEEAHARGLALTAENVLRVADAMRREHGPSVWAARTLAKLRGLKAEKAAVDGVRSLAEADTFRAALPDFLLAAVVASPATRHRRLLARPREDGLTSLEAARERDRRELEWGIGEAIAMADVTLVNEDLEEPAFRALVEALLRRL